MVRYVTCRISSPGMKRNQARHGASSSGGVRFGVLTSRWISQGYRDKHCSWPSAKKHSVEILRRICRRVEPPMHEARYFLAPLPSDIDLVLHEIYRPDSGHFRAECERTGCRCGSGGRII